MSNPFNIIHNINQRIEQEKQNKIGISIAMIMFSTGIASLSAAMAVHGEVSMFILMTAIILTVGTAVLSISQQSLKIIAWSFIASVIINTIMLFYQIIVS